MTTLFRILACSIFAAVLSAPAQTFSSGSTGVDGDLIINTPGVTVLTQTPQSGGTVFNFKAIQIAAGATLRLSGQVYNSPLFFLAQSAVTIDGTIDLNGTQGHPGDGISADRLPSIPGAGGFAGGVGALGASPFQPGNGPAGGTAPIGACGISQGAGGGFTGNQFLVPLVGGSGGSGNVAGGGAGGGALLVASSVSITLNGVITANGGKGGNPDGGGAGGGAIRLVAPTIAGTGTITAGRSVSGCSCGCGGSSAQWNGANGAVRLEAFQNTFSGNVSGTLNRGTPFGLFLPATIPTVKVLTIGGVAVNMSPTGSFTIPDVTVNSNSPLLVQIQAQNVPVGTTVTLFIFPENGPDQTISSSPLNGTLASSSATAMLTLPSGFARGYVKATWTQ